MGTTLLVCSGGGHLKQLHTLAERIGIPAADQFWVTFRNGLSESLLEGREVEYVPFVAPRDAWTIGKLSRRARQILQDRTFDAALSTGSGPAVAFLPQTARKGIPTHYIESAARAEGPSMSGKILGKYFPKVSTYTQYPAWSDDRWLYRGSIFDSFQPGPTAAEERPIRRAVVSIGTQDGYGFDRLFKTVVPLLQGCDEVLWQSGVQDLSSYGITGRSSVPHGEMKAAVKEADVVIAHCGTGAALTALEEGKCPILAPRLARHGEHIDNHQLEIGREMERRGLAMMRPADAITVDDLLLAARRSSVTVTAPPLILDVRGREPGPVPRQRPISGVSGAGQLRVT